MKASQFAINNIFFSFKPGIHFFGGLHFSIKSGVLHFLQGANGSGKSTLLRILQGNINSGESLQGTLFLDGIEYAIAHNRVDEKFSSQVKLVGQQISAMLSDEFTVAQNLSFANLPLFPRLKRLPNFYYTTMLKDFGIDLDKPVHLLSGGQRQMLAILMALQKQTRILLLDEPTAALDQKNAHIVLDCLALLAKKTNLIVLIITHDRELVATYSPGGSFRIQEKEDGTRFICFQLP